MVLPFTRQKWAGFLVAGFLLAHGAVAVAQDDSVARQAIISALTQNDAGLRQAYGSAQMQSSQPGTIALSDAVHYLYNCTRTSREEFLAGQEILAASTKDKDWRNRVILSLLSDEAYELNRLEGQNRFNKFTRVFNRVSTSLSQLVLLQPQAAASLLWDGIYGVREGKEATVKERKMVYLCDQFLRKYADAPERNEVVALRQELKQKMISDRAKALDKAGRTAISEGKFGLAEWHLEKAAILNPADAEIGKLLAESRVLKTRVEEVRGLTLGVSDWEGRLAPDQAKAVGDIAAATVKSDIKTLEKIRGSVPYVGDSVEFAYAALTEKRGDHEAALSRLNTLSSTAPQSPGGKAAAKLLDNPNYNLSHSFQQAIIDMASDKNHFIWTGRRSKDESVYAAGSAVIQNATNPVAVPMLFGMDAAVRAISEQFRTQVNVDGVIDAGARYLRKYPKTARSQEISRELANLSKKAGDYRSSLQYLEESGGGSPEEVAKLKENQSKLLYEQATKASNLLEKRRLLSQLQKDYPDTKIVKNKLAEEQAKLPPALSDDTLVLQPEALKRDPNLAHYLGIPANLLDGKGSGKISAEGVAITPSADAAEFLLKGETQWRRVPLTRDPATRDWLLTAVKQLRQEYLTATNASDENKHLKVPLALKGGVGSSGVDIAPQFVPYTTSQQDKARFD